MFKKRCYKASSRATIPHQPFVTSARLNTTTLHFQITIVTSNIQLQVSMNFKRNNCNDKGDEFDARSGTCRFALGRSYARLLLRTAFEDANRKVCFLSAAFVQQQKWR